MTEKSKTLHQKLSLIQTKLKAPKGQYNSFGKYKYRSAEDILEALKPYLEEHQLTLTIHEYTEELGGYLILNSTATLMDVSGNELHVRAQAGVNPERKGMDIAQSFGASSSYAKKYALGNMFLLDDTKDADATSNPKKVDKPAKATKKKMTKEVMDLMLSAIEGGKSEQVEKRMSDYTMTKVQKDTITKAIA